MSWRSCPAACRVGPPCAPAALVTAVTSTMQRFVFAEKIGTVVQFRSEISDSPLPVLLCECTDGQPFSCLRHRMSWLRFRTRHSSIPMTEHMFNKAYAAAPRLSRFAQICRFDRAKRCRLKSGVVTLLPCVADVRTVLKNWCFVRALLSKLRRL